MRTPARRVAARRVIRTGGSWPSRTSRGRWPCLARYGPRRRRPLRRRRRPQRAARCRSAWSGPVTVGLTRCASAQKRPLLRKVSTHAAKLEPGRPVWGESSEYAHGEVTQSRFERATPALGVPTGDHTFAHVALTWSNLVLTVVPRSYGQAAGTTPFIRSFVGVLLLRLVRVTGRVGR